MFDATRFGHIRRMARGRTAHWREQLLVGVVPKDLWSPRLRKLGFVEGDDYWHHGSINHQRSLARHLAVREAALLLTAPDNTQRCCQCGADKVLLNAAVVGVDRETGEETQIAPAEHMVSTWICQECGLYVCRDCTVTESLAYDFATNRKPGTTKWEWNTYLHETLCSKPCWEKAGRPED